LIVGVVVAPDDVAADHAALLLVGGVWSVPSRAKYRSAVNWASSGNPGALPRLRPDPAARPRLVQIRDNLIARIAEAESHRWLGEAEGLKVSLAGARAKLAQMNQIAARRNQTVQLSIPPFTETAGRASTNPPSHRNRP
jgi:hypothetical protein